MRFWDEMDRHGDSVAFIQPGGHKISYRELAAAADAFPAECGKLLLLELEPNISSMIAYLGALRRSAPVVIINANSDIVAERLIETFAPAGRWSPARGLQALGEGPSVHPDLAVLLSTSGTTGATKLVRLSAAAVDANARSIAAYLGLSGAERAITTLPLGYSYGLSVINSHLAVGASVILNNLSVADAGFRTVVEEHEATSLAGVPYTYELLERGGFRQGVPKSIRTMTQAGGKLPADRVQAIGRVAAEQGRRFYVMYGQTEATARMAYLPPDRLDDHPDCIGVAIPGGRLDLVDPETGAPVAERGELVYSGPNIMMGYAENATDLARGAELDRLHTGDLAERVGDLFRIVGRKSRFLKLFGLRLSLEEIEREGAALGIAIVATGVDELLVVAAEEGSAEAARAHFAERYGIPATNIVAQDGPIPRLASGKVDYQVMIARARDQASAANKASDGIGGHEQDALEALRRLFARAFPRRAIEDGDSFLSLDGDSLNYITVSLGIEQITGALPERWETLPIEALARLGGVSRTRRWVRVEAGVLARCLAPIMIVTNHAGGTAVRGGAALLLIVAGQNFARFFRSDLAEARLGKVIRAITVNILIPYWLIVSAFGLAKHRLAWSELLLVDNWLALDPGRPFETWFVQVLAQATLICLAIAAIPSGRRLWRDRPFAISYGLLVTGAVLAIAHYLFWRPVLTNGGRELTWQLWLFAAGLTTIFATNTARRLAVFALVLAVAIPLYGADPSRLIASVGGLALLLWVRNIPMPRASLPLVTLIGSSSLFIYMMHGRAPVGSVTADWPLDLIRIGSGIVIGIATWFAYEQGRKLLGKAWRRIRPEA